MNKVTGEFNALHEDITEMWPVADTKERMMIVSILGLVFVFLISLLAMGAAVILYAWPTIILALLAAVGVHFLGPKLEPVQKKRYRTKRERPLQNRQ